MWHAAALFPTRLDTDAAGQLGAGNCKWNCIVIACSRELERKLNSIWKSNHGQPQVLGHMYLFYTDLSDEHILQYVTKWWRTQWTGQRTRCLTASNCSASTQEISLVAFKLIAYKGAKIVRFGVHRTRRRVLAKLLRRDSIFKKLLAGERDASKCF